MVNNDGNNYYGNSYYTGNAGNSSNTTNTNRPRPTQTNPFLEFFKEKANYIKNKLESKPKKSQTEPKIENNRVEKQRFEKIETKPTTEETEIKPKLEQKVEKTKIEKQRLEKIDSEPRIEKSATMLNFENIENVPSVVESKFDPEEVKRVKNSIYELMCEIGKGVINDSPPGQTTALSSIGVIQMFSQFVVHFSDAKDKYDFLQRIGPNVSLSLFRHALKEIRSDLSTLNDSFPTSKKHGKLANINNVNALGNFGFGVKNDDEDVKVFTAKTAAELRDVINAFVEKETNGKVKNIIQSTSAMSIVVNTFSFEFFWKNRFLKESTVLKPFYFTNELGKEKKTQALTMSMTFVKGSSIPVEDGDEPFRFLDGITILEKDNFKVLSLPYISSENQYTLDEDDEPRLIVRAARNELSYPLHEMIILPNVGVSLKEINNELNYNGIIKLANELKQTKMKIEPIHIEIPLLNIESDPDITAQFDKIIPEVYYKALFSHTFVMKQDEVGTRVTTASVAQMKCQTNKEMIVNRPFMFIVMHDNMILAQGAVKSNDALVTDRAELQ